MLAFGSRPPPASKGSGPARWAPQGDLQEVNDLMVRAKLRRSDEQGWEWLPHFTYVIGRPIIATGSMLTCGWNDALHGWLLGIAVDPSRQHQGLGKQIVARLIDEAVEAGAEDVWLETMFWNGRFYNACGFEHVPVAFAPAGALERRKHLNCMMMRHRLGRAA